jgi:hypothetical protein
MSMQAYYGVVYRHFHVVDGVERGYVGQTVRKAEFRFNDYLGDAEKGFDHPFCEAIRKHGKESFTTEILEYIYTNHADLNAAELFWGNWYNALVDQGGYSLRVGNNPARMSAKTKKQIGESNKIAYSTAEAREAQSVRSKANYDNPEYVAKFQAGIKKRSENPDFGAKVSEGKVRKWGDPEWAAKQPVNDPERQAKLQAAARLVTSKPEFGEAISVRLKGVPLTEAHKSNIRLSRKGLVVTEAAKANVKAAANTPEERLRRSNLMKLTRAKQAAKKAAIRIVELIAKNEGLI